MPPSAKAPGDAKLFLDAVRAVAGEDGVRAVQETMGGTFVRIPRRIRAHHWLARAVGTADANAVCAELRVLNAEGRVASHLSFTMPLGQRSSMARARAHAEELLLKGVGVRNVALKVGVHERTVSRLRGRLIAAGRLAPAQVSEPRGAA